MKKRKIYGLAHNRTDLSARTQKNEITRQKIDSKLCCAAMATNPISTLFRSLSLVMYAFVRYVYYFFPCENPKSTTALAASFGVTPLQQVPNKFELNKTAPMAT